MKNINWVKVVGVACTIVGIAVNIINGIVDDKKIDAKIEEKVNLKLKNMFPGD